MKGMLLLSLSFFWLLLIYYSVLALAGLYSRLRPTAARPLPHYPSVDLFIPAHNEGVVLQATLHAMSQLHYPGKLNVFLLNDESSDETANIAADFAAMFKAFHHIRVPAGEPKGKSRVLNYGLTLATSDYFAVYDADNQPEPFAVQRLVEAAAATPNAAGAVGYVKTLNATVNGLTRMIAIEFQVFQLLMQSGRWALFQLGSLAGTNLLLRRSVIEDIGGYDPYALAEDAELTMRLTAKGYVLPVVHEAKTWEQEPEKWKVFVRQRTRWLLGNLYLLEKSWTDRRFWRGRTLFHTLQHLATYVLFVVFLLFSNVWFVLSVFRYPLPVIASPLLLFWYMSYVVFTVQLWSGMVLDKTTSPRNIAVGALMYFTYAQIFVVLLAKSVFTYIYTRWRKRTIHWDKTVRFKQGKDS